VKIEWTPAGGSAITLGDDAAKHTVALEQWGGSALEQVSGLFRSNNPAVFARLNVVSKFVFTSAKSYTTRADAIAAFKTCRGYVKAKGSIVVTEGTTTATMAGAHLAEVELVRAIGVRLWLRFVFTITTIT
jgi:hypothetical protein